MEASVRIGYHSTAPLLSRLRELVNSDFSQVSIGRGSYPLTNGEGESSSLFDNGEVCVQVITLETGATMPAHAHEEVEFVVMLSGVLRVSRKTKDSWEEVELKRKDNVFMSAGEMHKIECINEAQFLLITVPSRPHEI